MAKWFFSSTFLLFLGNWIGQIALNWYAYQLNENPMDLALINFFRLAPIFILSLWAGSIADRYRRSTLIKMTVTSSMVITGTLTVCVLFMNDIPMFYLYIYACLRGCMSAIETPVRQAVLPDISERLSVSKAVSYHSFLLNVCRSIGIEQQQALETHLLQEDEMNQKAQYLERTRHFYQECKQLKEKYTRMTNIEQTIQKLVQDNEEAMQTLKAIDKDDLERQPDYEKKSQLQTEQAVLVEKVATLRIAQNHATLQARQQQQLQQYTEDLKRIDAEIAQKKANIQVISENEQQLLKHEQAVMTLRATLSQNDPCPVCGQTVHHVEADADIEQIKKIQQENRIIEQTLEKLKEQKIKCDANIAHTKAQLAEIGEVDFNEEDLKKAEAEQHDIKQKLEAIDKENSRIATIQEEVGRIHQVIDENQQQIQLLKNEQEYIQERMDRFVAETAYDDIETFQSAFTQLKSAVDQFYQEKATLTERRDQLTTKIKEQQYEIQLCVHQIIERSKQVQTLNADIDEALEALNIQNRETLLDILQDSVYKEAYEQEVKTYHQ
ncbi:MFS transporter [Staphylococcus pseudintermedius]|nr:MFS transporter [Staphylococcus pseudintermedius]